MGSQIEHKTNNVKGVEDDPATTTSCGNDAYPFESVKATYKNKKRSS